MMINKKQIAFNVSKRTQPIRYIVVHDTGNSDKGANAEAHYHYFNGGDRQASADFFVDDTQALQVNDYTKYYTWHCGDGHGKYGINNQNSIGIELCINSDGDYDAAWHKTVDLTRGLMAELCIDVAHVVRHYDASRKHCPASMAANDWSLWKYFLKAVSTPPELTSINDIVWELASREILTEKAYWLDRMEKDQNVYWLARKTVAFLRSKNV